MAEAGLLVRIPVEMLVEERERGDNELANTTTFRTDAVELPAAPGPSTVRLRSYNLFMRPLGIRSSYSGDYKDARLDDYARTHVGTCDIAAFQELFSYANGRPAKLLAAASSSGLIHHTQSPPGGVFPYFAIDGGLAIASRFPIVQGAKVLYHRGVHSDRFALKGALYARIALSPSAHVHVFTSHLQASYTHPTVLLEPSVQIRLQQLFILKEFIDLSTADADPSEPIILMGDLNVNARAERADPIKESEEYQLMVKILAGQTTAAEVVPSHAHELQKHPRRMRVRDVLFEGLKEHPITHGDVTDFATFTPKETVLSAESGASACCSIDHILALSPDSPDLDSGTFSVPLSSSSIYEFVETRVNPFHVSDRPYTQLSDHYAVETTLRVHL